MNADMFYKVFPDGVASKHQVNKHFRDTDESHLYPICGRFDVTERAIRKYRKDAAGGGWGDVDGLEYFLGLDALIGEIVNSEI